MQWIKSLSNRARGQSVERLVEKYIRQQGIIIVKMNYHCRAGEIDIIAKDKQTLLFIEVKFRSNVDFGAATEMVSAAKQAKLIKTAKHYIVNHCDVWPDCRFDVIALSGKKNPDIEWIKNAFYTE